MPKPFNGVVDLDVRESIPDWKAFVAGRAPECVFDVADAAYVDVERHLAAAMERV